MQIINMDANCLHGLPWTDVVVITQDDIAGFSKPIFDP